MSTIRTQTPWAVLLCKFNDNDTEPFHRRFYDNLFTSSGIGMNNMVDYFRLYSHGSIDLGDSCVFGWFSLPESLAEASRQPREHILDLAKQTASNEGVDLSSFWGVLVCTNVPYQTFGFQNGRAAVADAAGTFPGILGQEMGHGYGLDHARIDGSTADWQDPWDVMSALNSRMATDPQFGGIGPGLNAANMDGRGWLDSERVWIKSEQFHPTVTLRPHHRRDLDGFLVARVGAYYVEYRSRKGWDAAIDRPAVLVHRFDGNHSYLMRGTAGNADLQPGDKFQGPDGQSTAEIDVIGLDAETEEVTIRAVYRTTPVQTTEVPDVTELSIAAATRAIRAAGLAPKFTGRGTWVGSQSPAAGAEVARGSEVRCGVRSGPIP